MSSYYDKVEGDGESHSDGLPRRLLLALRVHWKSIILTILPLAMLPLALSDLDREKCAFVVLLMSFYWMFELLPLAATAVLPVILCPVLGLLSTNDVSMMYMKVRISIMFNEKEKIGRFVVLSVSLQGSNMLFVGALILATSIEECGLHRRIALTAIKLIGSSPGLLMLGFMVATAGLSMWISNTATSAMMVPIMEVVLGELESIAGPQGVDSGKEEAKKKLRQTRAMLAMAICFSANIGGTGTLIGTGSNVVLNEYLGDFKGQPVGRCQLRK